MAVASIANRARMTTPTNGSVLFGASCRPPMPPVLHLHEPEALWVTRMNPAGRPPRHRSRRGSGPGAAMGLRWRPDWAPPGVASMVSFCRRSLSACLYEHDGERFAVVSGHRCWGTCGVPGPPQWLSHPLSHLVRSSHQLLTCRGAGERCGDVGEQGADRRKVALTAHSRLPGGRSQAHCAPTLAELEYEFRIAANGGPRWLR